MVVAVLLAIAGAYFWQRQPPPPEAPPPVATSAAPAAPVAEPPLAVEAPPPILHPHYAALAARLASRMPTMIVKADRANIRSGPGARYRIVTQAKYGDLLKTKKQSGRWVNVTLPHNQKSV